MISLSRIVGSSSRAVAGRRASGLFCEADASRDMCARDFEKELLAKVGFDAANTATRQIRCKNTRFHVPYLFACICKYGGANTLRKTSPVPESEADTDLRRGAQIGRPALPSCRRVRILCERDPLCPVPSPLRAAMRPPPSLLQNPAKVGTCLSSTQP